MMMRQWVGRLGRLGVCGILLLVFCALSAGCAKIPLLNRRAGAQWGALRDAIQSGRIRTVEPKDDPRGRGISFTWPSQVHEGEFSRVDTFHVYYRRPDRAVEDWAAVVGRRRSDNQWVVIRVSRRVGDDQWEDLLIERDGGE